MSLLKTKKRAATLLELLIAFSLAALLFSFLFFYYSAFNKIESDTRNKVGKRQQMVLFEKRLQKLFLSVLPIKKNVDKRIFFSQSGSIHAKEGSEELFLTYDNGSDWQKGLSGHVIGRLFLDKEGRLILFTVPLEEDPEDPDVAKEEVLLDGIDNLSFSFFPAFYSEDTQGISPFRARGIWLNQWERSYSEIPALIKVKIKGSSKSDDENEKKFFFYLPKAPHIVY